MTPPAASKRPAVALTPGSRVRLRSAGPEETAIVSSGTFRGLVSIGGDNAIAIELDGSDGDEKGRVRHNPLPALLAIDILEVVKAEEERRPDAEPAPGYFR